MLSFFVYAALFLAAPSFGAIVTKRADSTRQHLGCYESGNPTILHHYAGSFTDLTIASCLTLCGNNGFALAGLEWGRECLCGDHVAYGYGTAAEPCDQPCTGNSDEICGGIDAVDVWTTGSGKAYLIADGPPVPIKNYGGFRYIGCHSDTRHLSTLPGDTRLLQQTITNIPIDNMTVEKCLDACSAAGFHYAGLEFGRECYCGNLPAGAQLGRLATDGHCNVACYGDAAHLCGGSNHLTAYTNIQEVPALPVRR